jgi:hypothetical protein
MTMEGQLDGALIPGLYGAPTPVAPQSSTGSVYQSRSAAFLNNATAGAVDTDPRTWSPADAAAQTDRALSRVAAVNPQLAQELAAQQGMQEEQGEDKGFFGTIMGGLGTLLEVTHLDDVLEVISRPAKILPEVIMDWGEESVWKNVGDAMMGHSDVSWDDVLVEKLGMERNWFTAALGFVGDVALDPLTYATMGLGGIARQTAGMTLSKAAIKGGLETFEEVGESALMKLARPAAEEIAAKTGRSVADVSGEMVLNTIKAHGVGELAAKSNSVLSRIGKNVGMIHDDAVGGVLNTIDNKLATHELLELTSIADNAFKAGYRGNWRKLSSKTAADLGIDKAKVDAALKASVKAGSGFAPLGTKGYKATKASYNEARAASAALGGWQMRLNIPVLGLRIAPHRLLPAAVPQFSFGTGRRFFAGIAGEVRLERLVGKGAATVDDLKLFWEGGYRKLALESPDIARKLGGGSVLGRIGSPYMSMSQQVGRLTEHLAPHAKALRHGGLGGALATDAARSAKHAKSSVADSMMSTTRADGTPMNSAATARLLDEQFAFKDLDGAGQLELARDLDEYVRLTPADVGYGSIKEGYERLGGRLGGVLSPAQQADMTRAVELEAKLLGKNQLEAANVLRRVIHRRDELLFQHGLTPDGYKSPFSHMDSMRPEDAKRAAEQGALHVRGVQYEFVDEADNAAENFGDAILRDRDGAGTLARGAQVRKVAEGGYDTPSSAVARKAATKALNRAKDKLAVAAKRGEDVEGLLAEYEAAAVSLREATAPSTRLVVHAKNGVVRDLRTNVPTTETKVTAGSPIDELPIIQEEIARVRGLMGDKLDEALEGADPDIARIVKEMVEDGDGAVSESTTRWLQMQGYDHIRTITDEGEFLTVFRNADGTIPVARIEADAPWAVGDRSPSMRWVTEDVMTQVNRSKAHRDLPGGSKAWLEQEVRKVATMNHDDAERALRQALRSQGLDIGPNQRILEADPFKALDQHVRQASGRITDRLLGKTARSLESLGLAKTVLNGELAGFAKYKYVLNPTIFGRLKELGEDHYQSVERVAALQKEKLPELQKAAEDASAALQSHFERLEDVTAALDPGDVAARTLPGLDEVMNPLQEELNAAITKGEVVKLSDDTYRRTAPDGTNTYYHVDPPAEVADGLPEGEELFYHYVKPGKGKTSEEIADLIEEQGIKAAYDKAAVGDTRKFVFASRARGGIVPEDRVVIAFRAPTTSITSTGARQGSAAISFTGDITPDRIVARHAAGKVVGPHLRGVREVSPTGIVDMKVAPSAKLEAVETALTRQHWTDEGVYSADEPLEKAAEVMNRGRAAGDERLLKKEAKVTEQRLRKNQRSAQRTLEGEQAAVAAGIEETNKLATKMTTEAIAVKPAFFEIGPGTESSVGMAGLERLDIPGFETMAMPSFMAQEFKQAMKGFDRIDGPHLQLRKFNSWWKSHATYMWPGFHVRNLYGAFFNNMLGGVDVSDYVMASRIQRAADELDKGVTDGRWAATKLSSKSDRDILQALTRHGHKEYYGVPVEELTYGDLARSMQGEGVFASNGRAFAEARLGVSDIESAGQGKRFSERTVGLKQYTGAMKRAGTLTENVMRGAAFSRGLRDYGSSVDARISTMLRHGDYSDLTDFEYGVVRDIIPFYKWMRTNVPFQVHQLLETPGKLLAVEKAQSAVFTGFGLDYDEERYKMPSWMGRSFVIPRGVEEDGTFNAVMLDLPMSDLHMSAREFVSSALPLMRPFMENYIYEQSTFTGAPIAGKRIPLAGVFNVPGIRDVLGAVGLAEKGEGGVMYTTDKNQNLLGVLPIFSRFRDWLYADPDRTKNRMNAFGSAIFGATLRSVDQDAMASAELDFYYSQVLPAMDHLREMGYVLPTTADIEAAYGTAGMALQRLGITPASEQVGG